MYCSVAREYTRASHAGKLGVWVGGDGLHMLSCRTRLVKLRCLKYLGSTVDASSAALCTMNVSPLYEITVIAVQWEVRVCRRATGYNLGSGR